MFLPRIKNYPKNKCSQITFRFLETKTKGWFGGFYSSKYHLQPNEWI